MTETIPQLLKFLTADRRSPTGTGHWIERRWRSVRGVLDPCENGLHATTADNLLPFLDAQLWRVEIGDEHVWDDDPSLGRKMVARRMRIVERVEAWNDRTARLFAADCAVRVLPLYEARYPGDTRPHEAIEVARRFARGEATQQEMDAARAASAAAWAAAWAARAAAWAARAASAAAWAAWAARAAAWAARDARAAAGAAAGDAARDAEGEWQSRHLADMLGLAWDAPEARP